MLWEPLQLLADTLIISADVLMQPSINVTPPPTLRPHRENFISSSEERAGTDMENIIPRVILYLTIIEK